MDKEELEELEKSYLDEGRHRKLDLKLQRDDDVDAEELAEQLKQRYSKADYGVFRGDKDVIPQNVLIPSIQDPKLCMLKCKAGREKEIVFTLMKKFFHLQATNKALKIHSVFYRDRIPGYVYIEGDTQAHIESCIQGLNYVYARSLKFIPVNEMVSCLVIKTKEQELQENMWVRIKRGKYAGDLGQIVMLDSADAVTVKLVPRLDPPGVESFKRKKQELRPLQRLFVYKDYAGGRDIESRDGGYYYQNEFYTKEGYLEKLIKVSSLTTINVNPTLEEVTLFSGGSVSENVQDVALIGSIASHTVVDFNVGENVQVVSGELAQVKGVVQSVQNGIVTILPDASLGFMVFFIL